jgi:hypothetical protein
MVSQWPMEDVIIHYGNYVGSTTGFGVIFFCFSMLFGASFLFAGMKDTRKRSAFLLWPVSNLEKYIISLLLSILWLAVITIGAYLLADTLRVFIDWVTGRVVIWGLPKIIDGVFGPAPFEYWQTAWMLFGAGGMFSQMKDTRTRSAYLLWPVSNLEKYVISLLLSVVLMAVVTIGAFMFADALRVFVDWVTGRVVIWGLPKFADGVFGPAPFEHWQAAWMLFTWVFYFHSLYIVGGTLFRRQQFLLTSVTIVAVSILLIIILNQIDWSGVDIEFINGYWDEKTQTYINVFHPLFYILNSVLCALIIFHYWASYKLFTRMQVINNKWLNV